MIENAVIPAGVDAGDEAGDRRLAINPAAAVWAPPAGVEPARAGALVRSFLDTAATSYGKATHYNTAAEVRAAERASHDALLAMDRELYALLLTLPGMTDRAHQLGVRNLLATTRSGQEHLLSTDGEREIAYRLAAALPPQRMLQLFAGLRGRDEHLGQGRVNNARARKLVLRTVLRARKLDLWAVKYRDKLRAALTHALGERKAGILRSILSKPADGRNAKEIKILREEIGRFGDGQRRLGWLYECVGFVLGAKPEGYGVEIFGKFQAAKRDLAAGTGLPIEVLEGIRSQYHAEVPSSVVIELCKDTMSRGRRMSVQRQARAAGVEVAMDPTVYDAVKLYVYAFEMGMSDDVAQALDAKARRSARDFPMRYGRLGILVDASRSMAGDHSQKLRPLATVLALRDMLGHTADEVVIRYAGARPAGHLVRPAGDTELARGLVELVRALPDAIYVLSDGYENAPAGRFAEVVAAFEQLGIRVPIHHLNPVMAAEASGVRELAPGRVATTPVHDLDGLGLSFLRHLVDVDPVQAVNALLGMTTFVNKELVP